MKEIKGNIIQLAKEGEFDMIIHGCNCFCKMGKGIAKSIKEHFPEAYKADCITKIGDRSKLGTYSHEYIKDYDLYVINAYTQFDYNRFKKTFNYDALEMVLKRLNRDIRLRNIFDFGMKTKIGYPKIGSGLAGGDWNRISKIIDRSLEGLDHTLVVYE